MFLRWKHQKEISYEPIGISTRAGTIKEQRRYEFKQEQQQQQKKKRR